MLLSAKNPVSRLATGILLTGLTVGVTAAASPEVSQERVENEALGCSILLPENGQAAVSGGDEAPFIRMVERGKVPPAWEIVIRDLRLPEPEGEFGQETPPPSPGAMMAAFVADAQVVNDQLGIDARIDDLRVADLPAARATASFRHESGRTARYDWNFIQTGPRRFLLVQLLADEARWPTELFDRMVDSLEVKTEAEIAAATLTSVERGTDLISRFDEETLRTLAGRLGEGAWYRLHGNDRNTGEPREFGYARLITMETLEDAVRQSGTPRETLTGDTGLLVWIQIRILPPRPNTPYRDVDHRAWLSWDRESELWLLRESDRMKNNEATRSTSIFGIRPRPTPEDPRRWLQVVSQSRETFERGDLKIEVPANLDHFLSEAERLVLPSLLAIVEDLPGEFGVYAWNEEREAITRRVEQWDPTGGEAGAGELASRPYRIARPAIQQVDPSGRLLKRITPIDGSSGTFEWQLIDGAKLRSLYLQKGIPFEG